jgi:hypothetical protein
VATDTGYGVVRAVVHVEYPLGSPAGYGGEIDPDKKIDMEFAYLNDQGDYLFSVMALNEASSEIVSVERVR